MTLVQPGRHSFWFTFLLLLFAFSVSAANEITVDRSSVFLDESFEITISLEGRFAALSDVIVPVRNGVLDGDPSTSSEFRWINGRSSRRKVFRFAAHATGVGVVIIGPVQLSDSQGSQSIPAITIKSLDSNQIANGSPTQMLRELERNGREKVLIVAEASASGVYVGQQVVVTWYLYTAESVRDFDIRSQPSLQDFWAEEIPTDKEATQTLRLDSYYVHKLPIRRVALFPLKPGNLVIEPLSAAAEILVRVDGPFGFSPFNRQYANVMRRSAPLGITVQPLPPATDGRPATYPAVGQLALQCTPPQTAPGGPATFTVSLRGIGNLRSASPPALSSGVNAAVDVQEGTLSVRRLRDSVEMTRSWTFLLFPRSAGLLTIPKIDYVTFDPYARQSRRLSCAEGSVAITGVISAESARREEADVATRSWPRVIVLSSVGLITVVLLSLAFRTIIRKRRSVDKRVLQWLTEADEVREMRVRLHDLLTRHGLVADDLFRSSSEQGESFRALHSLIEVYEKQSLTAVRSQRELDRRARRFLRSLS